MSKTTIRELTEIVNDINIINYEKNISDIIKNFENELYRGDLYNERDLKIQDLLTKNYRNLDNILSRIPNITEKEKTWIKLSSKCKLSEDFIREFKDNLNWNYISRNQKLSEDFIREFQDKVNWKYISEKQTLSKDFIREFQDRIKFEFLQDNKHLPLYLKIKFRVENFINNTSDTIYTFLSHVI